MTIYECLGIDEFLIDETIPLEMIIENIESIDARREARYLFGDISRVCLRASLKRNEHYLQVIEIEVNSARNLGRISELLQKTIPYLALFILVYQGRYLILRRSFNVTELTGHVYTYHASLSTNWIYEEHLNEEILCLCHINRIQSYYEDAYELGYRPKRSDYDNGDYFYFEDLWANVQALDAAMIGSDVVGVRYLLDWINIHSAGYNCDIRDILEQVRLHQAFHVIGDHLYIEKSCTRFAIGSLFRFDYPPSLDYTGRHPLLYYSDIHYMATDDDEIELMKWMLQDGDLYDDPYIDLIRGKGTEARELRSQLSRVCNRHVTPKNAVHSYSKRIMGEELASHLRSLGYHLTAEQNLPKQITFKLLEAGYKTLESLRMVCLKDIGDLTQHERIELLYYLDDISIRFSDCAKTDYPQIDSYITKHFRCETCGGTLNSIIYADDKYICQSCNDRFERLQSIYTIAPLISSIDWSATVQESILTVSVDLHRLSFRMDLRDIQLADACIITPNIDAYPCLDDSLTSPKAGLAQRIKLKWTFEKSFPQTDAQTMHIVFRNRKNGEHHLYIFNLNPKFYWQSDVNYACDLYDYYGVFDYAHYGFNRNRFKRREELALLKQIREHLDTRAAFDLCQNNMQCREIKELFEQYYVLENGIYFNRNKSIVIACQKNKKVFQQLSLPEGVEGIANGAFFGVKKIKKLILPETLKTIGEQSFASVTFSNPVTIPRSVKSIGRCAFGEALPDNNQVFLHSRIEYVGDNVFPESWEIIYPDLKPQVTKDWTSFGNCKILFGPDHEAGLVDAGTLCDCVWQVTSANELIIQGVGDIVLHHWDYDKNGAWQRYIERIQTIIIEKGIISIKAGGFFDCPNASSVVFPDNITAVYSDVFSKTKWFIKQNKKFLIVGEGCLIKVNTNESRVRIPDNVKTISRITDNVHLFERYCPHLEDLILGPSVKCILPHALEDARTLKSVLFNEGLLTIESCAFKGCSSLTFICLPNTVIRIESDAFCNCQSLQCIVLPESLDEIAHDAFSRCFKLEDIIVPFSRQELDKRIVTSFWGPNEFPYEKCRYSCRVLERGISERKELRLQPRSLKAQWLKRFPNCYIDINQEPLEDAVETKSERTEKEISALDLLPNIGPILSEQLKRVGITTVRELKKIPVEEIWLRLLEQNPAVDCNEIYAIDCAKNGIYMKDIDGKRRNALKKFVREKKGL